MSRVIQVGNTRETYIDEFNGGVVSDPRDPRGNVCRMVSNFDVITNPKKMSPYRSSENGNTNQATDTIRNFTIALRTGTTYSLYGLGRISAANNSAEVLYKDLTTGAANDLDDADWTTTANNQSSSGATNFNLFVYYARTGLIYGARAGTNIWAYDPAGSSAWADSNATFDYTNIAQGLVHSKDNILYVPYNNIIARNNNGSWTNAALTLPTHYVITSISEYGNYIAIAAAPTSGIGNSRVFLWDRDATLATLSESIDWGFGPIRVLEEVDGVLIGISQRGGASSTGGGTPSGTTSFADRVTFRRLEGNRAVKFLELVGGADTTKIPIAKQKVDNRLYFMMLIELGGSVRDGVWSIGRSSPDAPFALVHERTSNNDTVLATADIIENFYIVDDYMFTVHQPNAGDFAMRKTDDSNSGFSHTSIYESKKFNAGDGSLVKDLVGVTVTHEPLPSGASAVVRYRVDENTSWTTILTSDTDNDISRSAVNIESSGAALPKEYQEIEFRIQSTGGASGLGAEITGLSFKETIKRRAAYDPV